MAVSTVHPLYQKFQPFWTKMRDTYSGSDAVKGKGTVYLPATQGMCLDGMLEGQLGYQAYQAYVKRAVFHDFVADAVKVALGAMHCKPPTIELPEQMEPLRENATLYGESLMMLLRRINEQQLVTGRLGLLMDLPTDPDPRTPLPYIALYQSENIINWDAGTRDLQNRPRYNLIVLQESGYERQTDFEWEFVDKYRVYVLGNPEANEAPGQRAIAMVALVTEEESKNFTDVASLQYITPTYQGRPLQDIPFVIINSRDIVPEPDYPPLNGLADISLASYRGEADYRQSLFMQAQDTLVVVGADEDNHRTGAGAVINLKHNGEAYYIGVSADGLGEMAKALAADKTEAAHRAGQLIDNRARPFESGEALKVRQSGQSATLTEIAMAGGYALESLLRQMATWIGANPEEVVVKPNLDFSLTGMMSQELVELMTARTMGAPISLKTVHTLMEERGMTRLNFEQELVEMENDPELVPGTEAGGDEQPPEDNTEDTNESES